MALADEEIRDPTCCDGRKSINQVVCAGDLDHGLHGKMTFPHEKNWKPGEHEIEQVQDGKVTSASTPK